MPWEGILFGHFSRGGDINARVSQLIVIQCQSQIRQHSATELKLSQGLDFSCQLEVTSELGCQVNVFSQVQDKKNKLKSGQFLNVSHPLTDWTVAGNQQLN